MDQYSSLINNKKNYTLILLGFFQGILLYFFHNLFDQNIFNENNINIWLPLYSIIILLPLTFQLVFRNFSSKLFWLFIFLASLILILTGTYTGSIANLKFSNFSYIFSLTSSVSWFIALPFLQSYLNKERNGNLYKSLYHYTWKNFILILESCIFILLLWVLLNLCAALFEIIGVHFVSKLIAKKWFKYIVINTAFAISICILHNNENMIIFVRKNILNLLKWLLPINAIILLVFIAFLPFTGLEPLWNTHSATIIILIIIIWMIILFNASYQDTDNEMTFGPKLLTLIKISICTLPIYSAICIYALYLRVIQYGWSTDRVWASILIFIITVESIGYTYSCIYRREKWLNQISKVNIFVAILTIITLVLTNTPLLSPAKIAANSQIKRLLRDKISYELFDYYYFKYELGKIGIKKLKILEKLHDSEHKAAIAIRKKAEKVLNDKSPYWQHTRPIFSIKEIENKLTLFPAGTLDNNFLLFLQDNYNIKSCDNDKNCIVIYIDIDHDQIKEYILINKQHFGTVYKQNEKDEWKTIGYIKIPFQLSWDELIASLENQDFKPVAKKLDDLLIGKYLFHVNEE